MESIGQLLENPKKVENYWNSYEQINDWASFGLLYLVAESKYLGCNRSFKMFNNLPYGQELGLMMRIARN